MKPSIILPALFLALMPFITYSQQNVSAGNRDQRGAARDTIYVSHQAKSYLLFDELVSLADVGNPSLYLAQIEGNSILVVARQDSVPDTPFYAVVGGKPFTGRLAFRLHPEAFYDFRGRNSSSSPSDHSSSDVEVLDRMKSLDSYQDLNYVSSRENGISLALVGIIHDFSTTYLKFKVDNRTSLVYQTDFIGFERLKRYKKGFFAKENEARFPLDPVADWNIEPILPYSEKFLFYALPTQTLEKKESIMVTLREKNNGRSVSLKISSQLNRRADLY